MARTDTLPHFLTDVADAIREKKGTQETIQASDFDTEIENLPSGGDNNAKIDTSLQYDMSYGAGIRSLIKSIDEIDTSNMSNMNSMFNTCTHLYSIPLLDTSNVTNMANMFTRCLFLTDVPLLNTSKVTNMYGMFSDSFRLTDTSLDNVLQMCINSLETNKTLTRLGFTSTYYSASRIQALPHYQDFIDAGWTIGY